MLASGHYPEALLRFIYCSSLFYCARDVVLDCCDLADDVRRHYLESRNLRHLRHDEYGHAHRAGVSLPTLKNFYRASLPPLLQRIYLTRLRLKKQSIHSPRHAVRGHLATQLVSTIPTDVHGPDPCNECEPRVSDNQMEARRVNQ